MAAASPVSSSKIGDSINAIGSLNANTTPNRLNSFEMPKQNLRGLNKPKCIKCGNVARSRCPFHSCKSCCSKAENPCHIHVLKQGSTLPEKPPPFSSTVVEQPSNEMPSNGASWKLNSLRQLSSTFVNMLRAKKPLSREDAVNVNRWRLMKLREHIQGNVEAEDEAFERYTRNISLLEETFIVREGMALGAQPALVATSEDENQKMVSEIKMKLKANAERTNNFRERIRSLIDEKSMKLQQTELVTDDGLINDDDEVDDHRELKRSKKALKWRIKRNAAINDLIDKLNKARNEDDLRSCLELKLQLLNQTDYATDTYKDLKPEGHLRLKQANLCNLPKMWRTVQVDQDALSNINEEFSSLSHIAEL